MWRWCESVVVSFPSSLVGKQSDVKLLLITLTALLAFSIHLPPRERQKTFSDSQNAQSRACTNSCYTLTCVITIYQYCLAVCIPYSGKHSREKTFTNFTVLCLCAKVFLQIWGRDVLWHGRSKQSTKVFSLESFLLYGIYLSINS